MTAQTPGYIGNMYGPDFSFLGIEKCDLSDPNTFQGLDVVIVGAPIDSGTSYRSGEIGRAHV